MDIDGNEEADKAAKTAAKSNGSTRIYAALKSARNATNKTQTRDKWTKQWNEGKETATLLRGMSKRPHFTSGGKLYSQVKGKRQVAALVRLRTSHVALNEYLHRFGHEEEPTCKCGEENENVEHYLLKCKNYATQRAILVKEVGAGGMRLERLLGDAKYVKFTLEFIRETNRFGF